MPDDPVLKLLGFTSGIVQTYGLPQKTQEKVNECEKYKSALVAACDAILSIIIGNPRYKPPAASQQVVEYPIGQSPAEQYERTINALRPRWIDDKLIKENVTQARLMCNKQKEFQNRSRRQIHLIRAFINCTYSEFNDMKREVMSGKDQMATANEDLKKGETDVRKQALARATEKYQNELKRMEIFLDVTMPELRKKHVEEIRAFFEEIENYYLWMASFHKVLANYRMPKQP